MGIFAQPILKISDSPKEVRYIAKSLYIKEKYSRM